jgi:glycosyltransferase involved in cell wall biosynthesis
MIDSGPLRFRFLTSTPQDITRGSGTYVGISVLAGALRELGHAVDFESPTRHFPIFTAERLWFNRGLRVSTAHDCTVGFDMDGYRIAGAPGALHIASLKGVIADEVRFESGFTRLTMGVQASCERLHVQRAARVLVTSRYSGECAQRLYGLERFPTVVPELIDVAAWRRHLAEFAAPATGSARFTVLYVGRFYRRKRVGLLLEATAQLRGAIPNLEIRIVGNGPCDAAWREQADKLKLGNTVTWLGDISRAALAAEYNRTDVFCLPSVQEGFGIVLLEAMAAGKPIVAARAAAIPEVAPHARLVKPDSAAALAEGVLALWGSPGESAAQSAKSLAWVEQFDAPRVARLFVETVCATGRSG